MSLAKIARLLILHRDKKEPEEKLKEGIMKQEPNEKVQLGSGVMALWVFLMFVSLIGWMER